MTASSDASFIQVMYNVTNATPRLPIWFCSTVPDIYNVCYREVASDLKHIGEFELIIFSEKLVISDSGQLIGS